MEKLGETIPNWKEWCAFDMEAIYKNIVSKVVRYHMLSCLPDWLV